MADDDTYPGGTVWGIIPENPELDLILPEGLKVKFSKWLRNVFAPQEEQGVPDAQTDPVSKFVYMSNKLKLRTEAAQQRPMVRLADRNLHVWMELTQEMSCDYEELMSDSGHARMVVKYEDWIADEILNYTQINSDVHVLIDPMPTDRSWKTRWGGKIHQINVKRNEDGTKTLELVAVSSREHAKNLLFASNPFFAPEVQIPKMWVLPGPLRSVCFATMFCNLARLFLPGLSGITNAFNPVAWLNPLNPSVVDNLDPLAWPIQVAFVNPLLDQSRWTVLGASWTDWHTATSEMLKDAGNVLRAYTWLVDEDYDSPHDELAALTNSSNTFLANLFKAVGYGNTSQFFKDLGSEPWHKISRPKRSCIVFRVEDWSGMDGPTGTAIDGLLNLIGITLDDLFTSLLIHADTGQTLQGEKVIDVIQPTTPIFEAILGVAPKIPHVIWREGYYDKVPQRTHTLYKAPPKTLMTGGKSPTIVNESIDFGIHYGLSQLSDLINPLIGSTTPAASNTAFQAPGTNGLTFLYQGQLDNTLFAWQRITEPARALWAGDVAYQEYLDKGSDTAYTLAAVKNLREAAFKTRPYYGFQANVISGWPWVLDVDVRLGQRAGWEFDGIIYVDMITAIQRKWSRHEPVMPTVSVGDDKDREDPIARGFRALQSVYTTLTTFVGQGSLFG